MPLSIIEESLLENIPIKDLAHHKLNNIIKSHKKYTPEINNSLTYRYLILYNDDYLTSQ